jgi:hypothetical protein
LTIAQRRYLMPREMMENERSSAINPGEAVEEKNSDFGIDHDSADCRQP